MSLKRNLRTDKPSNKPLQIPNLIPSCSRFLIKPSQQVSFLVGSDLMFALFVVCSINDIEFILMTVPAIIKARLGCQVHVIITSFYPKCSAKVVFTSDNDF